MKLYMAVAGANFNDFSQSKPIVFFAHDDNEAYRIALGAAHEHYPDQEGWYAHVASAVVIPIEAIKRAMQYHQESERMELIFLDVSR